MPIPYRIDGSDDYLILRLANGTTVCVEEEDGKTLIHIHEENTALSLIGEPEITHVSGTDRLANLPILTFDELHHIGTLNNELRRQGSHEGCHLSVSTHPDAWRKIHTTDTGLKTLKKPAARFVDAHAIPDEHRDGILKWAYAEGIIEEITAYALQQEDEDRNIVTRLFATLEEAESECYDDDDINNIKAVDTYMLTHQLIERMNLYANSTYIEAFDYVLMAFAEDFTDADGVFWTDDLDIYRYSAPRGALFNSKFDTFSVTAHD